MPMGGGGGRPAKGGGGGGRSSFFCGLKGNCSQKILPSASLQHVGQGQMGASLTASGRLGGAYPRGNAAAHFTPLHPLFPAPACPLLTSA